eukprot:gb/GEZN01007199.1/.p1 GENE.gb/GEZN01007199.1/~~gb/GEZN01007199.1/.p1  ORF type:complete len:445 (+),score=92.21 gb/GEZN01007199.1/:29-1363(+)
MDYTPLLEESRVGAVGWNPLRVAGGLAGLFLTALGGLAASSGLLRADAKAPTESTPNPAQFVPNEGVEKVLVKPGAPGPLNVVPAPKGNKGDNNTKIPLCIFSYRSLTLHDNGPRHFELDAVSKEDGWVYGAQRPSGTLAIPTGNKAHILKGRLLCWKKYFDFKEKLSTADRFRGYNPNQPDLGWVRRGVVDVVKKDGSTTQAYWYYQDTLNCKASGVLKDSPPQLKYFDAKGAAEVIRTLFAAAGVKYEDKRYTFGFKDGMPKVEEQHEIDKLGGLFDENLQRLPVLTLADGTTIGQSRAIERFVARDLGMVGRTELEAAAVDCYCEHVRDIRDAWGKVRGSPFAPPNEETIAKKNKFYLEDLPTWMKKLETVTDGEGFTVGDTLTLSDVVLYVTLTQFFDDAEKVIAAYADCPNIRAVVDKVGKNKGIKSWLANRPESMMRL